MRTMLLQLLLTLPASVGLAQSTTELSLQDALSLALQNHPTLVGFEQEIRAREAEAAQLGRAPNPELELELENFGGSGSFSGVESLESTLVLSRLLELGGKRTRRVELASLDRELANEEFRTQRLIVIHETTSAFLELLVAQQRSELAQELESLAESTLQAVETRLRAGGASQVDAGQARVALQTRQVDRMLAEEQVTLRRQLLAAQWSATDADELRARGDLVALADSIPSLEALASLLEQNPRLARRMLELQRRQASLALARAESRVDLSVGAGVRHDAASGDVGLVLGLSTPLPLFDRGRDRTAAAGERLDQADALVDADRRSLVAQLATARASLQEAFSEARMLRELVLPEAERSMALAREAYDAGQARLTVVLETQRTHFELRDRYVHALGRYHGSLAQLELLVGGPVGGIR